MQPNVRRLQDVFLKAMRAPSSADRTAILERECGSDDELRRWALKLLNKHDLPNSDLDTPALEWATPNSNGSTNNDDPDEFESGVIIAKRYRLIDRLGRGGMGTVYRAEQISPVRRIVAVKLIRNDYDSQSVLARFESERQALAKMNHPNIAKIYDGGVIESREAATDPQSSILAPRPYFVMEFIDGIPITQFCAREKLSLRQRLELFIPVCQAIEHAHQKGIIHRDLKPGNILVAERDGRSVPIVIDFGIAKCTEGRIDDATHHTGCGLFLGTFDYMAPEHALGSSEGTDTRADVYSLGAVLYQLLTGQVPLDRSRMREPSVFELADMLREQEPAAPSVRVSQDKVAAELRGELDWIVMKCLEKNRERRYPSARALADDLNRYLTDEPVSAGPPSVSYRMRKFVRRHLHAVLAACVVLLLLIGGIAGTTWGMVKAQKSEANALAALAEEERQRKRADAETADMRFMSNVFHVELARSANDIGQADPTETSETRKNFRAIVDDLASRIETRFHDRPSLELYNRSAIASAYEKLGEYELACNHFKRAVELSEKRWGPDHNLTIRACQGLAKCLVSLGQVDQAIPLFERTLAACQTMHGPMHDKTLFAESDLGGALRKVGRIDEAEPLLRHVHESRESLAPNSPNAMRALGNLAGLDHDRGRSSEALEKMLILKDKLTKNEIELLPNLPLMKLVGLYLIHNLHNDNGIPLLEAVRDASLRIHGIEKSQYITDVIQLADAYCAVGRIADARSLLEENRTQLETKLGPNDHRVARYSVELARLLVDSGDLEAAETLTLATDADLKNSTTNDVVVKALNTSIRGRCAFLKGRPVDAEVHVRESLAILQRHVKEDWQAYDTRALLGLILVAQGRFTEAESELLTSYKGPANPPTPRSYSAQRQLPQVLEALIHCCEAANRPADAVKWRAERDRLNNGKQN